MSKQIWTESLAWATADGTAIVSSSSEALVMPNITIPANYMQDGRALRSRSFGKLSTTATPTITFRKRWGGLAGTLLGLTPAITNGSGISNMCWSVESLYQTRSNGSAGTILVLGDVSVNTATTPTVVAATFCVAGVQTPAAVTVDLTADTALSFTAQWSAPSASNTLTGMIYVLEALN